VRLLTLKEENKLGVAEHKVLRKMLMELKVNEVKDIM
jgi:hypothetical protein